jgi:hypothetical protein
MKLASRFQVGFNRPMGTKSRETIYGTSVRASAERAAEGRKNADRLACQEKKELNELNEFNAPAVAAREPAKPISISNEVLSPERQAAIALGLVFLKLLASRIMRNRRRPITAFLISRPCGSKLLLA